ncbi:MAG: diguanylate cyclase [Spirochaetota bacterium]
MDPRMRRRDHERKSTTFGLLLDWPDATGNYQRLILEGIQAFAAEHDVSFLAFAVGRLHTPFVWERGRELLYDFVNPERLDGLLVYSSAISNFSGLEALGERLKTYSSIPIVHIGCRLDQGGAVLVDNTHGFRNLVVHLIRDHGYRRLGFIGGPPGNDEAQSRRETFLETARELGVEVPERNMCDGLFTIDSGRDGVIELVAKRGIDVQAIICANDNTAIGAWQELWARRKGVPTDIAITGFDDLEVSSFLELPLTTVHQPLHEQGYAAARLLYEMIEAGEVDHGETRVLPTEVVLRGSCGCTVGVRMPPQRVHEDREERRGSCVDFRGSQRDAMQSAIRLFAEERAGSPLIRGWNGVLLRAVECRVRQDEVHQLLDDVIGELRKVSLPTGQAGLLGRKIETMRQMITDFYIQADLLTRVRNESVFQNTMFAVDDFEQYTITHATLVKSLDHLEAILQEARIDTCLLSVFDNPSELPDGTSTLLFAYTQGERRAIPDDEARFRTSDVLHPSFAPADRYELILEALYEGPEKMGLVCFGMGAEGPDTYEMLRRRLSTVIRSVTTTERLVTLNRRLEDEIEVREKMEVELKSALEALKNLSLTDELTGLYNRRGFLTLGEQQLKYCQREGEPCLVLYCDMNGLKAINDRYGHAEGDFAIRTAATILKRTFRDVDIVARLGGDEFTVFAGKADASKIRIMRERLERISGEVTSTIDKEYSIELSVGFYEYSEGGPDSLPQMIDLADASMYVEKRRNRGGADS